MNAIEAVNPVVAAAVNAASNPAASSGVVAETAQSAELDSHAEPSPHSVLTGRERIDALDSQIVELVLRRIEVSKQIQAARIAEGGRRVDMRRENDIIARYHEPLGRPGTAIAMALLELGRGRA